MDRRHFIGSMALTCAMGLGGASQAEDFKAAIVMPGNITDQSWNQQGYEAITTAGTELGMDVAYSEKVPQPDQLEAMSDYARRGYNVVFGHGGEFVDSVERAAERNPDTLFVVTNGFVSGENYASLTFDFQQFGYVIGVIAGRMTESGKVGYISAQRIKISTDLENGFRKGFQTVYPEADIIVTYTNDWDDVAKGKEAALNQIQQGVDVIFPLLDNAQIGALQAAQENKVWSFGVWQDVYANWPETVLQSAVMDYRVAIVDFLKDARDGKVKGEVYQIGIGTPAGTLGTFNPAIPAEVVSEVEEIIRQLHDGELKL